MSLTDEIKAKMAAKKEGVEEETVSEMEDKLSKFEKSYPEVADAKEEMVRKGSVEKDNLEGSIRVRRLWKEGGEVKEEESEEDLIEVKVPNPRVPLASVGFNCRMTIDLGNYESVQVGVFASVPCYMEEMDEAYNQTKMFVDHRLNKEIKSIRDYRVKKREEG